MANFYKVTNKKPVLEQQITVIIDRLDNNGVGVAKFQNKPLFIEGGLPSEQVTVKIIERKSKYAKAKIVSIIEPHSHRVTASCRHYHSCGGCDLQHLTFEQHLVYKKQKVSELFSRNDITAQLPWQPAINSQAWHYRRKARIGVQFNKNGEVTLGFRQKSSNQLTSVKNCPVLTTPLATIFPILKSLISQLSVRSAIGHIEVIATDLVTLIVRQLKPISEQDKNSWQQYAIKHHWQVVIDEGDCLTYLTKPTPLHYALPFNIKINFNVKDFIQINHDVNLAMIEQALQWLQLKSTDSVLDLFCGLGNFSLPMAKQVKQLVGIEGIESMVTAANENALNNGLDNCRFYQADLNSDWSTQPWALQAYDKVLLDPARAGAFEALGQLVKLSINTILYVSCDPTTLAKDSQLLLNQGYKIEKISLIEMFSQTKHIETMVLFVKH